MRTNRSFISTLLLCAFVLSSIPQSQAATLKYDKTGEQIICNEYIFIGMRGSGEKFGSSNGGANQFSSMMGAPIASLYDELNKNPLLKNKMTPEGVKGYVAADFGLNASYLSAVTNESGFALIDRFRMYAEKCPDAQFILAGYSQGAYAVHFLLDYYQEGFPQYLERIVATVLLASPSRPNLGALAAGQNATPSVVKIVEPIQSQLLVSATVAEMISRVQNASAVAQFLDKVLKKSFEGYVELESLLFKSNYLSNLKKIPPGFSQDTYTLIEYLKNLSTDLEEPSVPTLFYQREGDVIADFYTALSTSLEITADVEKSIENQYKVFDPRRQFAKQMTFPYVLYTVMTDAGAKHSSYCPKPKLSTVSSACVESVNQKFLKASVDFVVKNVKTYEIPSKWLGEGWIGRGATCETVLDIMKGSSLPEARKYLKNGFLPVLAVQPKEKSIWFLNASSYDHFDLLAFTKGKRWGFPDNLQGSYGKTLGPIAGFEPYFFDPGIKHAGLQLDLNGSTFTCKKK
jgi:pimeloyl-ACP methyl ester carboxylesterase